MYANLVIPPGSQILWNLRHRITVVKLATAAGRVWHTEFGGMPLKAIAVAFIWIFGVGYLLLFSPGCTAPRPPKGGAVPVAANQFVTRPIPNPQSPIPTDTLFTVPNPRAIHPHPSCAIPFPW